MDQPADDEGHGGSGRGEPGEQRSPSRAVRQPSHGERGDRAEEMQRAGEGGARHRGAARVRPLERESRCQERGNPCPHASHLPRVAGVAGDEQPRLPVAGHLVAQPHAGGARVHAVLKGHERDDEHGGARRRQQPA